VSTIQKDGVVWRDLVEVPTRRKNRWSPKGFNPPATSYPLARLFLIDALFHFCQKRFEAGDAFKVERNLPKADAGKMMMRVSHSRHHRSAVEIDDAGSLPDVVLRRAI